MVNMRNMKKKKVLYFPKSYLLHFLRTFHTMRYVIFRQIWWDFLIDYGI